MEKTVIKVKNLSKKYQLGVINHETFQEEFSSRIAKLKGKEDPNKPVYYRDDHKKFMALDNLNFEIKQGERVGLIGLNGAGKSTLLKILSRITLPTSGSAEVWGRVSSMLEIGTGFHREMTGRENIYMNGAILGMTKKEIAEKEKDIIDYSEIGEFIDTPVKRYSSGMYVRLAFAVAAYLNSDIMIMDEVLAVGDVKFRDKCIEKMAEISEAENKTILCVSHNMTTIRKLCNRVIVLKTGKIVYDGDVEKGIDVYMNSAGYNESTDKDLIHNIMPRNSLLEMKHLTLVDKDSNHYTKDEELKLKISIEVRKKIKNVKFRLTFRNKDDEAIATFFTNHLNFDEGQKEVTVSYSLKDLIGGRLYCSIGFYEEEYGNLKQLDHITRAFMIEVNDVSASYNNAYGYINLKKGKLEE